MLPKDALGNPGKGGQSALRGEGAHLPLIHSCLCPVFLPPTPSPSFSEGSREGSPGLGAIGQGMFSHMAQVRPCTPHKSWGGSGQDRRGMWLRCDLIHPQELARKTYQFLKPM